MSKYIIPRFFQLEDVPEFQRFQANNPHSIINGQQTAVAYGRAIHWMAFYQVLWPPFDQEDFYYVEVDYIVCNDPDWQVLPHTFYQQIALILKTFWTIQLTDLYPAGDWDVEITDQAGEIFVEANIRKRHK